MSLIEIRSDIQKLYIDYLYFFMNIIVMIDVAIIDIILAIIEGRFNPSGACRIYANAIKVHRIAGANVTI